MNETMTTTGARPVTRGRAHLSVMLLTELKLMVREPAAILFPIVLPVALLLILGASIPGFRTPVPELGGERVVDTQLPSMMTILSIATTALTLLPSVLATYRQNGVLRRMSTTPVSPTRLLAVHLILNLAMAAIATALLIVLGGIVLGVAVPGQFAGFLLVFLLGTAAMLALGLLVAVLAPNARSAPGVGSLVMFPLLFMGGMWVPRDNMPDVLRKISDYTVSGALGQALRDTWQGAAPSALALVVMAAWLVVMSVLAVRLFRWE
jgi:ABC-2 type transport system permease protein